MELPVQKLPYILTILSDELLFEVASVQMGAPDTRPTKASIAGRYRMVVVLVVPFEPIRLQGVF